MKEQRLRYEGPMTIILKDPDAVTIPKNFNCDGPSVHADDCEIVEIFTGFQFFVRDGLLKLKHNDISEIRNGEGEILWQNQNSQGRKL